jgi:beta-lactamase regulating signal transducer with metallopeptidase domain
MMPVAVTYGLRQPVIVVSQGMLLHYSSPELESVLIHELAHAVRRDNRWNWLIGLLRDMLVLLPTSHLAWQQMIASQEEACDDFSIFWTGRPLDLARSLVKALQYPHSRELAWLSGLFLIAATFRSANAVEMRIKRIIHAQRHGPQPPAGVSVSLPYAAMVFLFLLYALPIAVGC